MELCLDSANMKEMKRIQHLVSWSRTNNHTYFYATGKYVPDIDGTIVKLSKIVPVLQMEALGSNADEIKKEAYRQ